MIHKVTAFITRPSPAGPELLLFEHLYAVIQIPAGTVEDGETPAQAALREAAEETGLALADLSIQRCLGSEDERLPADQRVTTPGPCRGHHGNHSLCPARRDQL